MRTLRISAATMLAAVLSCASQAAGAASPTAPNGEARKPAGMVLSDARGAVKKVKTVTISERVTDQGRHISFSFSYVNGVGSIGSYSEGNASAQIIQIGHDLYFRGNATLLGEPASATVVGRYLHFSTTSPVGRAFGAYTNLRTITSTLLASPAMTGTVSTGHVGDIAAVTLSYPDTSRIYVNGKGSPLPLKITGTKAAPGSVTFTRYNVRLTLRRPSDSITIKG